MLKPSYSILITSILLGVSAFAAGPKITIKNPDLTQGEPIPEQGKHTWTLGATGASGWIFSDKLTTTDARQIAITKVAKGSPSDGILQTGDVILGVGGKAFAHDPRTEFGKALTVAESNAGKGDFTMTRWRAGKTEEIVLKIPVLGEYSATAPYDCPKSKRILELGCAALAKRVADPAYNQNPMTRSINALALLASGNPEYLPLVKQEAQWASAYTADSMQTWYYAYAIMLLAEYQIATGDSSFQSGLRRLALESANGQSRVGSWGHKFALPDGRLAGYGMMNAPGVPLTISLVLAKNAGLTDPEIESAIERSARLLRFYIGKGAVPYGDHDPWTQTHEDNGKCGMAAVLFDFLQEPAGAQFFSRMSIASHGPERDTGHCGNFTNMLWAMPGVALSGPHASGAWMKEFGAWYFDLARRWDGSFPHQGPPQIGNDSYGGWDATGGYLLAYAMPLKKIQLTGKRPTASPQVDPETAQSLILDGRGWSNKDRTSTYDKLSGDQLLECLESWSPTVRERASIAISRSKQVPVPALLAMLESPRLEARYGACEALTMLGEKSAAAVPMLRKTLHHDDLWLRIKAANTLVAIGDPAMVAVPEMLELLARTDAVNDPRGMQQRYLSSSLFGDPRKMLGKSLDGVDRDLLFKAVRAGLKNEDGRSRGSYSTVYQNLSSKEIEPLLPVILQAVVEPAPSGEMFADGIRLSGLEVLAKHGVEEGIKACVNYTRTQNPWSSEKRTPQLMGILLNYGVHAKSVIPELEEIAKTFAAGEKNFPGHLSQQKAAAIRDAIRRIEACNEAPKLIRIQ